MTRDTAPDAAERPQKNNAVLEVRLPDTVKAEFAARCRAEGRSVSEAVRGFIDSHMADGSAAAPRQYFRRLLMTRTARRAGAGLAAALAASALGLSLISPTTAEADDLGLSFRLEIIDVVERNGERELVSQEIRSTLNVDYGRPASFTLPAAPEAGASRAFDIAVLARSCVQDPEPECGEANVVVEFSVTRTGAAEGDVIAAPRLIVRSGEHAELQARLSEGGFIEVEVEAHPLDPAR